jgi:NDP-sugar pyrophosphorylase family protein
MEAIILAGGKAERLGDAGGSGPKALRRVAGRPLAAHQVEQLVAAGVERVLVSCARGHEADFAAALAGLGVDVVPVAEPEPLGRGGGLRLGAAHRAETGPLYALNGDELLDVDLHALLAQHRELGAAATIVVAQVRSPFGVVELGDDGYVRGFREAPLLSDWVSAGTYVLDDEAIARLPERGDHETTTFPELAAEGRLGGFRHDGVWLTVNTPKDLRRAEEHFAANPGWRPATTRERASQ